MDRFRLDVHSAWRSMAIQRGATAAIVAVLGLGIGLVATMFALADPFVLKPLPYPSPHQLVSISIGSEAGAGRTWSTRQNVPAVRDWTERRDLFQAITPFLAYPVLLRIRQGNRTMGLRVSEASNVALQMLGQRDVRCDAPPPSRCVVLTARTLDRHFAGRHDVIGTTLVTSDGPSIQIAGVLPPIFLFPWASTTTPIEAVLLPSTEVDDNEAVSSVPFLARLQPDVSPRMTQSALSATLADPRKWLVRVTTLESQLVGSTKYMAWAALLGGLLILFVCAGNVANLMFARGISRGAELATRTALGASRRDLARLLMTELAMLTTAAVGTGVGLAGATVVLLRRVVPAQYAVLGEPAITLRVCVFAALVGVLVVLSSALLAWVALRSQSFVGFHTLRLNRVDPGSSLRFVVVAAQSGLAMVLLTGTMVLGRSYLDLFSQDTGFSRSTLLVSTSYPETLFGGPLREVVDSTVEQLRRVRGVEYAGAKAGPGGLISRLRGAGASGLMADGHRLNDVLPKHVTTGFFEASGTPIVAGRTLTSADVNRSGIVVSESFARRVWPDRPAVGQFVTMQQQPLRVATVVGVVKDTFDNSLDLKPLPSVYVMLEDPVRCTGCEIGVTYVIRGSGESGLVREASSVVTKVMPDAFIAEAGTTADRYLRSVAERVFAALVVSLFATAAIAVSVAGLVGIVTFITTRRMREIAIRLAVGARSGNILSVLSVETLSAVSLGLVCGLVTTRFASAILERVTYEVELNTWSTGLPSAVAMCCLPPSLSA
jgi:putative ABC transport system permease protein